MLPLAILIMLIGVGREVCGAERGEEVFFSELNGLDQNFIVQETVRVDFRPLTNKDVMDQRLDVELTCDLELDTETSLEGISFLIPESASVSRLILDSSSLTFQTKKVASREALSRLGDKLNASDSNDEIQECQFDAAIAAGKHRIVVGLRIPLGRRELNRYEVTFWCPRLSDSNSTGLKLQYAVPDNWQFSVDQRGLQEGTDGQIKIESGEIRETFNLAAMENYAWNLGAKVAVQDVYEFDRRFSIAGWIFMTAIAVTAFLSAIIVWYQGGKQFAYGSLCLCGSMAVVGFGAALILPNQSNQMRVVRQQDHDELIMLANRLLLNQLQGTTGDQSEGIDYASVLPLFGGNVVPVGDDTGEDLTPVLVALMRQSNAIRMGGCFSSLDETADHKTALKEPRRTYYVILRDGPSTVSLYEVKAEGSKLSSHVVATSAIPTQLRMGATISDADVSEFRKALLKDYLR